MKRSEKGVLLVGTFVSAARSTHSVGEGLAARLTEAGWEVHLTSTREARAARLYDMLATAWRLRDRYAVAQVDVFSGLAFVWAEAVCGLLHLLGKPYVLTLHGGNLPAFSARWPRRVRRLLQSAAVVTTPSRYLLERMGSFRADLRLVPNPLDVAAYPFRPRSCPAPRLVWVRAFHAIYNPELAAAVVARLAPDFPDVQLVMVGPDKDGSLQRTRAAAVAHGVEACLTFTGGVPNTEVPGWLDRGDVFLNTTNVDNTPVSVLEAMSCGLCVVSTDVGGIPYLLDDGRDAMLVSPGDDAAMARQIRRVLTEPGLAERLSRNAREKAERFDWAGILPVWEGILSDVARIPAWTGDGASAEADACR